jgi:hypothetical protein
VVLVKASAKGRSLVGRVEAVRADHLQRALGRWTKAEQVELGRLLVKLADDLQAAPYLPT